MGAEGVEAFHDVLVAAVDLLDILYHALSFGGEGGDEQGDAGTDVGLGHHGGAQLLAALQPDDDGAMRVAQGDLRPH